MDAATVLAKWNSFCPAIYKSIDAAGIEIGFDWKTALAISAQTVKGGRNANGRTSASEQLIDSDDSKGCTIAGLNEMEMHGFSSSLIRGIKASLTQIKG
jgi:pyrroline-5-carboxylate reductase